MLNFKLSIGVALLAGVLAGCSAQSISQPTTTANSDKPATEQPSAEGARFRLSAEPTGAVEVIGVRSDATDGDQVVVVGRIGGDVNPWVQGRAAFSLVDNSIRACSDIPGDGCPTPWDYCCETDKLKTGKILVKFVDEGGQLIASDARELLGVRELDTVVVKGKVQKSADGNAVLLANGVYVKSRFTGGAAETGHDHHGHDHEGHDDEHKQHQHDEVQPADAAANKS